MHMLGSLSGDWAQTRRLHRLRVLMSVRRDKGMAMRQNFERSERKKSFDCNFLEFSTPAVIVCAKSWRSRAVIGRIEYSGMLTAIPRATRGTDSKRSVEGRLGPSTASLA